MCVVTYRKPWFSQPSIPGKLEQKSTFSMLKLPPQVPPFSDKPSYTRLLAISPLDPIKYLSCIPMIFHYNGNITLGK